MYGGRCHIICKFKWETLQFAVSQLRTMPFGAALEYKTYIGMSRICLWWRPWPLLQAQCLPTASPVPSQSCSPLNHFEVHLLKRLFLALSYTPVVPGSFRTIEPCCFICYFPRNLTNENCIKYWDRMGMCYTLQKADLYLTETSGFSLTEEPIIGRIAGNMAVWKENSVKECLSAYSSKSHFIS